MIGFVRPCKCGVGVGTYKRFGQEFSIGIRPLRHKATAEMGGGLLKKGRFTTTQSRHTSTESVQKGKWRPWRSPTAKNAGFFRRLEELPVANCFVK